MATEIRIRKESQRKDSIFQKLKRNFSIRLIIWKTLLKKLIKDDETYVKWQQYCTTGEWPNLKDPKTYNEKLAWLKLYYHNPQYTLMSDKIEAKKYVASIIGEEYIIPLYGIYSNPDEIDFETLPNQFVIKCNHNSGNGMCVCIDKEELDVEYVKKRLRDNLAVDYFLSCREWAYKNINRRILIEKFMVDESGKELKDYKFFCFNGEPKIIWHGSNYVPTHFDFFDLNWNNLHIKYGYDNSEEQLPAPSNLDEMILLAKRLSAGIPHVRVDFYNINGKIYFGEFTFYTWGGNGKFEPEKWNTQIGSWLTLPSQKCCNSATTEVFIES